MTNSRLRVLDGLPLSRKVRVIAARLRDKLTTKEQASSAFTIENLDLAAPEVARNPFPYYEELRKSGPVHFLPQNGFWLVIGFREVSAALMNPQIFSSRVPEWMAVDQVILGADPPQHTAVRRLIAPLFSAAALEECTHFSEQVAEKLLQPMLAGRPLNVLRGFGFPLSEEVVAHLIGLDRETIDKFRFLETEQRDVTDWLNRLDSVIEEVFDRLPLSAMLLKDSHGSLDQREIRSLIRFLWVAGTSTTRRAIASTVLMLLLNPDVKSKLESDDSLIGCFLEESFRLNPPEHTVARLSTIDTDISGTKIPAGSVVKLCIAAANRDAAQFEEPTAIRLSRTHNRHLSFGSGIHRCIGASLARVETAAAVRALLRLAPQFHSVKPLPVLDNASFANNIEELFVEC